MEEASVMMVGLNAKRILQGLAQLQNQTIGFRFPEQDQQIKDHISQITHSQSPFNNFRLVADYTMPNVSEKVVRIILSYTDYVKRVVWGSEQ